MNKTVSSRVVLVASVLTLCLPLAIRPAHSATADTTLTGTVSCSRCYELHSRKGTNRLSCTMLCVSQDAHYILLAGDKTYALEGNRNTIQNFGAATLLLPAAYTGTLLR
jgi:hypothetical protein